VAALKKAMKDAVEETGVFRSEFRIRRADDGMTGWMNGYGKVVAKVNGRATRMIGVMYDISEHKLMEMKKDEFLAIASHELKTPLTGIKGYTELLLAMVQEKGDKEYEAMLKKLEGQVDRLAGLTRALLDATRISEEQLALHPEKFDLNELVRNTLDQMKSISRKHSLVFRPENIKSVVADRERIGQVLSNLISNAIKYSPEGGEVTVTTRDAGDKVMVGVQDRGIGISEDLHARIFEKFFRLGHVHTDAFPGMGLGLYISSGIVQRHGGTISVDSKPGKGSLFTFSIPYEAHQSMV
jgi:signal transduction histidine kinase